MSLANSTIKKLSLDSLKGSFSNCTVVTIILISCYFIFNNIAALFQIVAGATVANILFLVLCFLGLSPVILGSIRYFWRLSCGVKDNPVCVFYYFSDFALYKRSLHLAFSLILRAMLLLLVFGIPTIILEVVSSTKLYEIIDMPIPIWTTNLSYFISFLKFFTVTATVFAMLKYYLAPMLTVADENMEIAEALHLSTIISKKTLLDFIFLLFGFLGWLLISVLVIPLIYSIPYFILSYLIHCSFAVQNFNSEIAKLNHDDVPTFVAGV